MKRLLKGRFTDYLNCSYWLSAAILPPWHDRSLGSEDSTVLHNFLDTYKTVFKRFCGDVVITLIYKEFGLSEQGQFGLLCKHPKIQPHQGDVHPIQISIQRTEEPPSVQRVLVV